jgi:hypothetical protein
MATHLLGTTANNSLVAVTFSQSQNVLSLADIATVNALAKYSNTSGLPALPGGAFNAQGLLVLPGNKGTIVLAPGDVVACDAATGWFIVLSAKAITSGPWVFT